MKEASENKMEISDFDEETVKNMVNFIYQGKIETECFTQELLSISEKYDINELKKRYNFRPFRKDVLPLKAIFMTDLISYN